MSIEHRAQVDKLLELGCPVGQGFFFYMPLTEEELHAELDAQDLHQPSSAVAVTTSSVA